MGAGHSHDHSSGNERSLKIARKRSIDDVWY